MRVHFVLILVLPVLASGCVASYSLVKGGVNRVDDLYVVADPGWNRAPYIPGSGKRMNSQTWTRDGVILNSLVFIPAVPDGEALIRSFEPGRALPAFRSNMLPNEIEELAESTFVKIYGEGNAVFNTSSLRPQLFGEHQGFMFDIEARITESPDYRGIAGGFIANDELYLMYFLAVETYYFAKDLAAADAVIKSATLTTPRQTR